MSRQTSARKVKPAKARSANAVLEARDGPTAEYRQHNRSLTYLDKTMTLRTLWQREIMTKDRSITPEACEAGGRYANDWLQGYAIRTKSSLDVMIGDGGFAARNMSDSSHDAAGRCQAAEDFIDDPSKGLWFGVFPTRPSVVLQWLCVENKTFTEIGRLIGRPRTGQAKTHCAELLEVLAGYYREVDGGRGKSSTAGTYHAALRRFDPELG